MLLGVLCVARCVLHSSVLSSHARLEDHVTLKDCQVGARFTVTKEGMCGVCTCVCMHV